MEEKKYMTSTTDLVDGGHAKIAIRTPDGEIHLGIGSEHHGEMRERIPNADYLTSSYTIQQGMNRLYYVRTHHDGVVYEGEFFTPVDLEGVKGGILEVLDLRQAQRVHQQS